MEKKLLIFAIYFNSGSMSTQNTTIKINELKENINSIFKKIELRTDYIIETFVFPIKEGETKMECIFTGDKTNFHFYSDKDDLLNLSSDFYNLLKKECTK